eukprot:CAMPEP_0113848438 /NCGR_PEP_ID=MMETSP0372-20130328/2476_1 /TAXON_ID=340204 /ORGANISM="Lankesteria abbotti" /LENGTH=288 /DNA_ID=CAMNT_0000817919 /DNA_START=130 /DNA_END=996 /DNA_ORIENTATION=+ /assembly_acc=CAM_ASM_000359
MKLDVAAVFTLCVMFVTNAEEPPAAPSLNTTHIVETYNALGWCDTDPCSCCSSDTILRAVEYASAVEGSPTCQSLLKKVFCAYECLPGNIALFNEEKSAVEFEMCTADCGLVAMVCGPIPFSRDAISVDNQARRMLRSVPTGVETAALMQPSLGIPQLTQMPQVPAALPPAQLLSLPEAAAPITAQPSVGIPPISNIPAAGVVATQEATENDSSLIDHTSLCESVRLPNVNITVTVEGFFSNSHEVKLAPLLIKSSSSSAAPCLSRGAGLNSVTKTSTLPLTVEPTEV